MSRTRVILYYSLCRISLLFMTLWLRNYNELSISTENIVAIVIRFWLDFHTQTGRNHKQSNSNTLAVREIQSTILFSFLDWFGRMSCRKRSRQSRHEHRSHCSISYSVTLSHAVTTGLFAVISHIGHSGRSFAWQTFHVRFGSWFPRLLRPLTFINLLRI